MSTYAERFWKLYYVPRSVPVYDETAFSRALDLSDSSDATIQLPARLVSRPFLISQAGELHTAVNSFFASAKMRNRAEDTNKRYARSLVVWVEFLHGRGVSWKEADEEDLLDFKFWRRHDTENSGRIAGSSWASDLAAFSEFYRWAQARLDGPPLFASNRSNARVRYPFTSHVGRESSDLRPTAVRRASVKWLSPGAVVRWRNVGIHGLTADGEERVRWRPRSQSRDAAFVDGLYGSGLRVQEWSSVLVEELSRRSLQGYSTFRLADACAKGGRGHAFWLREDALNAVAVYVETDRARAVRRGRASGLYESDQFSHVIQEVRSREVLILRDHKQDSRTASVRMNDLSPAERSRLLVDEKDGYAPAMLWLNEDGTPRRKGAWTKTFERANARVRRAGIEGLICHPHMLRHSFALRWFAVGRTIWSRQRSAIDDDHERDFREQFGDTWSLVQTMLGHSDVSTTKETYLEPFRNLEAKLLLEYGRTALDSETLVGLLGQDPRVRLSDNGSWE
ncbi:site-specific integrase [Microbacterium sp. NPDC078814]|jgi:site-specific recombinase XerD|uniref:site-specific integrase n=1 Tax=Microbacterium sp. NPDC078814 TaxID=3154767 RepID=UPI00344FCEDA